MNGGTYAKFRATNYNPAGKRRRKANLQKKKVFVPETGKSYSLLISARAVKTIVKNGAYKTLRKAGIIK